MDTQRAPWIAAWVALVLVGAAIIVMNGAYTWDAFGGHSPDVAADKYTTVAAWTGGNPYMPMSDLAAHYGYAEGGWPVAHPRPPGSFIALAPLAWVPDGLLLWVMLPVSAATVTVCFWGAYLLAGLRSPWWALSPLAGVFVYEGMVLYGSATNVVPGLVVAAWLLARRYPRSAGMLLGVAAAVKMWPAVVVGALVLRRGRAGWWAVGVGAALTGGGLLLPGATVEGTVQALTGAGTYFASAGVNYSATAAYGLAGLAAGVVLFGWGLLGGINRRFGAAIVAALLLSPISWAYYWLAAVPVAALIAVRVSGRWSSTRPSSCVGVGNAVRDPVGAQHDPGGS